MRPLAKLIVVIVSFIPLTAVGQGTTITGRVIDSQTLEPVPFANVFILNTSVGTSTDIGGNFTLKSENLGEVDIHISFIGYDNFKKRVAPSSQPVDLGIIRLKTSDTVLDEVVVKASRDARWEKDFKKFKAIFLGKDPFAAECTIQNPWVIDIQSDESSHFLSARSLAPIIIINNAMGYMVKFSLKRLVSDPQGYVIEGDSYFLELAPPTPKEGQRWTANRDNVYMSSATNMLRSIINHTIYGEGFLFYSDMPGNAGSLTRMSKFADNIGKKIELADTSSLVSKNEGTNKFTITLKGRMEVHNRKARSRLVVYQDINHRVSWVTLKSNSVVVNANGIPDDPTAVIVSGEMSNDRVSRMLPLDYRPKRVHVQEIVTETLPLLYEQIYMHTDKPYYYPGEQLWFKGYVNFSTPSFRDSLSRTVYVDLIKSDKTILISKILPVDSGRFAGGIDLPSGMDTGTYNLRAYTNLQRNYGDSILYLKPIPILDLKDLIEKIPAVPTTSEEFVISTSKEKYKPREKIEVTIKLANEEGHPIGADLSVSVTDIKQVSPVSITQGILERYPIATVPKGDDKTLTRSPFVLEHGITIRGKFMNNAGKPVKTTINVVQLNPRDLAIVDSDANGYFAVNHLSIYDSASFAITATDKKGRTYGRTVLIANDKPEVFFKELSTPLNIQTATTVQRDISYDKADDTRMLEAVEVKAQRIRDEFTMEYRVRRSYGKPDYVLDAKSLPQGYGDLLMALAGKFPGLIIRQAANAPDQPLPGVNPNGPSPKALNHGETRWVVYLARNNGGSAIGPQEVLVTVDDVVMAGKPETVLAMIHPEQVETVELRTRLNVLYGNVSNGGVLSIYLKKGESVTASNQKPPIGTVKAKGYSVASTFSGPDYDQEIVNRVDMRSLIHWAPVVQVKKNGVATLSFFAADLETTYQIEIEGITTEGKPVRAIKTVVVGN